MNTAALAIRIEYAIGKVQRDDDKRAEALQSAEALAVSNHIPDSEGTVPVMFQDEPELSAAYESGIRFVEELAEMSSCSCCNNESGDPCHFHG